MKWPRWRESSHYSERTHAHTDGYKKRERHKTQGSWEDGNNSDTRMMKDVSGVVRGGPCVCVGDFWTAGVFVVLYDSYECPFVNKQTEDTWLGPRMHFSASPLLGLNYISSQMDLLSGQSVCERVQEVLIAFFIYGP